MADFLLSNLSANWGVELEEPDPTRIDGLIQLSESSLEVSVEQLYSLQPHYQNLQGRILSSINELEQLTSKPDSAPDHVLDAAILAMEAFQDLEETLEQSLSLFGKGSPDDWWEILGRFEETAENVEQACLELAKATSQPSSS